MPDYSHMHINVGLDGLILLALYIIALTCAYPAAVLLIVYGELVGRSPCEGQVNRGPIQRHCGSVDHILESYCCTGVTCEV